jgi:stage V sporulation protein AC
MNSKGEMTQANLSKEEYDAMVKEVSPNSKMLLNCIKAFIVGGLICVAGQLITDYFISAHYNKEQAGMFTVIILICIASLLTGLGVYEKLGKFAGAGSIVPITGFSNSITAPAIEFKKEGYVFGVGAKMFLIAGPVLVYGTFASILVGTVYYLISVWR